MDRETRNRKARIARALRGAINNSVAVQAALNELLASNKAYAGICVSIEVGYLVKEDFSSKPSPSGKLRI